MKKLYINLVALLISTFSIAQSGALMEFKMTSSKGATGTFIMKHSDYGSKIDMNMVIPQMPGGGMKVTTLLQKDKPDVTYTLNEAKKTYTEQKRSTGNKDVEDKNTYVVKKIGEEKINGYKCIHALITQGKETYDVWNTKDIPDYAKYEEVMSSNKSMSTSKRQQAIKDAGCEGFTVKTVHKGNEREGDVTMELVKMEKKLYSKSDFEIPAGYTKSESGSGSSEMPAGMKTQEEIMKMTPEERAKYIEEMKKKYGK